MNVQIRSTPNKGRWRRAEDITLAVVHYTGSMHCAGTLAWFENPTAKVSAHYVIDLDGQVYQFETPTATLWHAGVSQWQGRERCNDFSIGYELVGDAHSGFTSDQYVTLGRLLSIHVGTYPIKAVVGHEHVSPGRKIDPGPLFDWTQLLLAGIGGQSSNPLLDKRLAYFGGKPVIRPVVDAGAADRREVDVGPAVAQEADKADSGQMESGKDPSPWAQLLIALIVALSGLLKRR